jgi:hypothetical protein
MSHTEKSQARREKQKEKKEREVQRLAAVYAKRKNQAAPAQAPEVPVVSILQSPALKRYV